MKEFDQWNEEKKKTEDQHEPYFREGEVRWFSAGINIGTETDGKGKYYLRPGLILKKFNKDSCLIIPLSRIHKSQKYIFSLGIIGKFESYANLSQIKNISSKRLQNKIQNIDIQALAHIKKIARELLFPDDFPNSPLGERKP